MKSKTALIRFVLGLKRPSKKTALRTMNRRGETAQSYIIRDAADDDISKLSALHVKAWSETYWVIKKPPAYEIRLHQWQQRFKENDGSWFCLVVEDSYAELVGFAQGLQYNHSDLPAYAGELNKIFLLRTHQRIGLGQRLMCKAAQRFLSMGITSMVLFGLAENPSIYFHEAMGGERLYGKDGKFNGGYGWKDLNGLATLCAK